MMFLQFLPKKKKRIKNLTVFFFKQSYASKTGELGIAFRVSNLQIFPRN